MEVWIEISIKTVTFKNCPLWALDQLKFGFHRMFFCSETFWQNLQLEAKMSIMKQFKLTKLISCCIFNDILLHLQPVA